MLVRMVGVMNSGAKSARVLLGSADMQLFTGIDLNRQDDLTKA